MKVLNFGSLNYDYVYSVDHIAAPGETQNSLEMNIFCGGKGLNQSIAIAKTGIHVYHAGMTGEDDELFRMTAARAKVDMTYVKTIKGKSGHAIIQVDKGAQNSILLYGGANRAITKDYVDEVISSFEKGDMILLQNEISELGYIIDQAAEKGMTILLNPSPFDDQLKECDLNKVTYFLINEIEGYQMTGQKAPEKILEVMRQLYPASFTVLTLGDKGSYFQKGEQLYYQPAYPVKAVDTTAAGDTFTGYFIYGLLNEMAPKEQLQLCAKASALAVSRKGAAVSIPSLEEAQTAFK